jgi:hypothetical protein
VGFDPNLGPLADNGGTTLTHELLQGSLAIDAAGTVGIPATDQRGIARPQGPAADIGAFERVVIAVGDVVVDILADEDDGNIDPGDISLREAAMIVSPGGTITFAAGLSGGTITLTGGSILLDRDMTITGLGTANLTINGNLATRLLTVDTTTTVSISGLTLTGGRAIGANSGGAILNAGRLTLTDTVLTGNSSER